MQQRPEVLLLGFGGVGALYAFVLHQAGANITAVCRSNYETVKEHGINIVSEKYGTFLNWHPEHVVRSADDIKDTNFDCTYIIRLTCRRHWCIQGCAGPAPEQ